MSTKFAPVAPPAILRALKQENLLGDYHLLLAHDIVKHQDEYRDIFEGTGAFIILDHSLVELGEPVSWETMQAAAKIVNPAVTVLPDHLRQKHRTVIDTTAAAKRWFKLGLEPFMAVPQGKTFLEICDCANLLKDLPGVTCWGVARDITDLLGTRLEVVRFLCDLRRDYSIHLLGFSDNVIDDLRCSSYAAGIDSAMPIRVGLQGLKIEDCLESHPPRGDFWEASESLNTQAQVNLQTVRRWFRGKRR